MLTTQFRLGPLSVGLSKSSQERNHFGSRPVVCGANSSERSIISLNQTLTGSMKWNSLSRTMCFLPRSGTWLALNQAWSEAQIA
jgi:hypothetical protein